MTPTALLEQARAAGLRIRVEGDRLKVAPASALTPELRAELLAHKPELLHLLVREEPATVAPPPLLLPANMGGYCPTHRRWLSFPEQQAECCSWCTQGVPLLSRQPPSPLWDDGLHCLECGVVLASGRRYRCPACVESAVQALVAQVETMSLSLRKDAP